MINKNFNYSNYSLSFFSGKSRGQTGIRESSRSPVVAPVVLFGLNISTDRSRVPEGLSLTFITHRRATTLPGRVLAGALNQTLIPSKSGRRNKSGMI